MKCYWGEGRMGSFYLMVSFWDDGKVSETDTGMVVISATELYIQKWLKWIILHYICFITIKKRETK